MLSLTKGQLRRDNHRLKNEPGHVTFHPLNRRRLRCNQSGVITKHPSTIRNQQPLRRIGDGTGRQASREQAPTQLAPQSEWKFWVCRACSCRLHFPNEPTRRCPECDSSTGFILEEESRKESAQFRYQCSRCNRYFINPPLFGECPGCGRNVTQI